MEFIFGGLLLIALLVGGLLLSDYVYRSGGTMEERRAVVFEVYRYTVCLLMVLLFGLSAFQLAAALITDPSNAQAMGGPGVGAIITGLFFLIHWFIKNPAVPKLSSSTKTEG